MQVSLRYGTDGKIENPLSAYQPSPEVRQLTSIAVQDVISGEEIINRPFNEFNGMSLIERMNTDQKDWMAWSPAPSDDPDEAWMFTGTSAATRNKIISTAAHLTAQVIYPNVYAQNKEDEEDEAAAYVMREAMEYYARRSNYEQTFLYSVISGLVNPVSYLKTDYCQAYQTILEGTHDKYTKKKVLDQVMSGFQDALLPPDEVLISNPYCFDFQKQPIVIQRRRISYNEAQSIYGDRDNFAHVKAGVISIGSTLDNLFYDVEDPVQDSLVEEAIVMSRTQDRQVAYVNGIYLGSPNVEFNPMKHRRVTKNGDTVPMYPIVKFGAEPIDAMRFWAYKSLASKLANDKELVDRMRQNAVDASTFATFPSIFTMGAGKMDRSVFIPATTLELGKDAKVQPATGLMNPSFAYTAAREAEQQMNETSQDPQLSGVGAGDKTARESMLIQQNALTNLGIMGRMIGTMVKELGELKIDNIVRYATVGEMQELGAGGLSMKYQTLVLNDKIKEGKKKSIVIRFTDSFAGYEMSEDEKREKEVSLYEEAGDDTEIYEVNPAVWSRLQYLVQVEPDALRPKNDAFSISSKLTIYDRAIANPLIAQDPEKLAEVTRDFLFEPTMKGESAKYIPKDTKRAISSLVAPPQKEGVAERVVEQNAMQSAGMLV